jgi:hypothetical protein
MNQPDLKTGFAGYALYAWAGVALVSPLAAVFWFVSRPRFFSSEIVTRYFPEVCFLVWAFMIILVAVDIRGASTPLGSLQVTPEKAYFELLLDAAHILSIILSICAGVLFALGEAFGIIQLYTLGAIFILLATCPMQNVKNLQGLYTLHSAEIFSVAQEGLTSLAPTDDNVPKIRFLIVSELRAEGYNVPRYLATDQAYRRYIADVAGCMPGSKGLPAGLKGAAPACEAVIAAHSGVGLRFQINLIGLCRDILITRGPVFYGLAASKV